jgi:AbrB family looped-hinge helix DNA binding protein
MVVMRSYRAIISSKGQVVIPVELREQFGLRQGTRATWTEEKGRLVLTPITEQRLDEIMGFLKPGPGEPSAFEMLFEERARERKREDQ